MKKVRFCIAAVLIALLVLGWMSLLIDTKKEKAAFLRYCSQGAEYAEKHLFQKAIQQYEEALKIKADPLVSNELINAYRAGLQDGTVTAAKYEQALQKACEQYPDSTEYWKELATHYTEKRNFSKAKSVCEQAIKAGVAYSQMEDLLDVVNYSVMEKRRAFSNVIMSPKGVFTVLNDEKWGILDSNAEESVRCNYQYIIPVSTNGYSVRVTERDTRVLDSKGVVQYLFEYEIHYGRAFGNDRIPVMLEDETWSYFNCPQGAMEEERYENASAFTGQYAVVRSNGEWMMIDAAGPREKIEKFDDVKLYQNGEFLYTDNYFVASRNGRYGLYNINGEPVNSFTAKDMDNYYGEAVAFSDDNGQWGYVDQEGKVLIEPQYLCAKSFSNGLAAVYNGEAWGFIKPSGKLVIDYKYRDASYFTAKGVCAISMLEGSYYFIALIQ